MNTKAVFLTKKRSSNPWRFNPLGLLNQRSLSRHLDEFEAGHLRQAAYIFDLLEQRDDLLRGVISKRKKSVARHGWTVLPIPGLEPEQEAEAREHATALEFFYNHVQCENAVDASERGGFKLLARQMMDAVGKRFAVHEIIWREEGKANGTNRRLVTARFRFVPLGFFENKSGELRLLESDSATDGVPLEPGAWMITVGEGLMIASATAWVLKNISLNDWLKSCERNGTPALIAVSASAAGTPERDALETVLADIEEGKPVIHGTSDSIRALDLLAGGNLPYPELVERVDRLLASLWRGADLSTLSRDRGYGASLQEKETCALEEDDAEMITETLNRYVDEWVIRHVFGEGIKPLARVQVLVSPRECTGSDLQVDEFLLRHGAPLSVEGTLHRYGRALPKPGEKVFLNPTNKPKASLPANSQNPGMAEPMGNEEAGAANSAGLEGQGPSVSSRGCSPESIGREHGVGTAPSTAAGPNASFPNEFTLLQDEWLQLSPYGDFPHARGIQRVDRKAAEEMVAQFNSFSARAGRLFGGVPFYAGHPDLPGASESVDRKAYGWIIELNTRDDGFYGRVKWSEAGLNLLRNAHYKFLSPFWEAKEVASESGRKVYRPTALISVGLTNQPNIPVRPLANEVEALCPTQPVQTVMHTKSCVDGLGARRSEWTSLQNRRDRIQERVLGKMRLGLTYDEAWENVKREHRGWFDEINLIEQAR
jgi:hypothetical protein